MSTAGMTKVTCPIFDSHKYPKWKAVMKKRLMAMNNELWTVTEIGLTDLCKMADADDIRKYTLLNLTAKDVISLSHLAKIGQADLGDGPQFAVHSHESLLHHGLPPRILMTIKDGAGNIRHSYSQHN